MKRKALPFDVKQLDDAAGTFEGYASVFGVIDAYEEEVVRGAFSQTLNEARSAGRWPKLLWQHDDREPIGTFTSMAEDDHGLKVSGRILLDAGPVEQRAYAHLKAGNIDGLSIGFTLYPGGIKYDADRGVTQLTNIKLWEISCVTFPANEDARIAQVKSALSSPKDCERLLRDAGFSRTEAKALMGGGFKALSREPRDAEAEGETEVLEALRELTEALRKATP